MRSAASVSFLCSTLMLSLWSIAPAQTIVPPLISFQGVLTDDAGVATNGAESMMFALHADSVSGSALWSETQSVVVSDGVFNVLLGEVTPVPDSVFDRIEVYLAVKVGSDGWMTPRRRLASTGWAFRTGCVISIWYKDSDGDGFGDDSSTTISCTMPSGFVDNNTDCNDDVFSINPGATELCNGLDDNCSSVADDGAADEDCGAGLTCVVGGACVGGSCEGTQLDCDDGELCTVDSCSEPGGCTNDPTLMNGSGCDDGDACTVSDQCADGACSGTPKDCDDSNECTDDACEPETGNCSSTPVAAGTSCSLGMCNENGVCLPPF